MPQSKFDKNLGKLRILGDCHESIGIYIYIYSLCVDAHYGMDDHTHIPCFDRGTFSFCMVNIIQ